MSTFTSATATVIKVTGIGLASPGPISIPGLQVGDVLIGGNWMAGPGAVETIVTVNDQLQQVSPVDFSGLAGLWYFIRGV